MAAESRVEDALGLRVPPGPPIRVGEVREDEAIRMGRVQQLKPADLIAVD
jgi:hypothetical protein